MARAPTEVLCQGGWWLLLRAAEDLQAGDELLDSGSKRSLSLKSSLKKELKRTS